MKDLEARKNKIIRTTLEIYKSLLEAGFHDDETYDPNYGSDIYKEETFFNTAFKRAIELDKKTSHYLNDEVYCEDIISISIDGKKYRYLLTCLEKSKDDSNEDSDENSDEDDIIIEYLDSDIHETFDYENDHTLSIFSDLGHLLIGKHIGEEIEYATGDDKNIHKVVILDTRKTKSSFKISPIEVESEIEDNERSK